MILSSFMLMAENIFNLAEFPSALSGILPGVRGGWDWRGFTFQKPVPGAYRNVGQNTQVGFITGGQLFQLFAPCLLVLKRTDAECHHGCAFRECGPGF